MPRRFVLIGPPIRRLDSIFLNLFSLAVAMTILNLWNPLHTGIPVASRVSAAAEIPSVAPAESRDLRLDLVRGLAIWCIFLDHIPQNAVNWITLRNYGFSGAADLFVFVSGYVAAMVYAKIIAERGFVVGMTRIFKRVWQLYAAYVVLLVIYIAVIGYVATRYAAPDIINEFNVVSLVDHPIQTLGHGLLLQSKALNLDILQLYIMLMALFAPVLWALLRKPALTMIGSFVFYIAARQNGWNMPSFPDGSWNFNPFCWQLLFVSGAWLALGGAKQIRSVFDSPVLLYFGIAYLGFALAMTLAGHFPPFGEMFPGWLFDAFNPREKTNLAPYRVLHFIIVALFLTRIVSKHWSGLDWPIFKPVITCGQQSLATFCVGVFLSFAAHLILITSSDTILMQVFVSAAGIAVMTLVAYAISWSKEQDLSLSMPTR
jgi:hypothetical protein